MASVDSSQNDGLKSGDCDINDIFKDLHDPVRNTETLVADFGESAIGRVAKKLGFELGEWWKVVGEREIASEKVKEMQLTPNKMEAAPPPP
ncbi:Glycosyl hydrolase family 100 [Artemisia annua]|uniref:Glycosyl hydrolase family 100 n=1 Tax=Artemisia annua TaxID=35608 RepID=A0A2U1L3U2_ARTAN|nr:Glycosyl hydrolase family 100 [Artemisia annua]